MKNDMLTKAAILMSMVLFLVLTAVFWQISQEEAQHEPPVVITIAPMGGITLDSVAPKKANMTLTLEEDKTGEVPEDMGLWSQSND